MIVTVHFPDLTEETYDAVDRVVCGSGLLTLEIGRTCVVYRRDQYRKVQVDETPQSPADSAGGGNMPAIGHGERQTRDAEAA